MFNEGYNGLLEQNKKDKKLDLNQKLKKIKIFPVKFDLEKHYDEYVVVLNFPFKLKILGDFGGGFYKLFRFKNCIQEVTSY